MGVVMMVVMMIRMIMTRRRIKQIISVHDPLLFLLIVKTRQTQAEMRIMQLVVEVEVVEIREAEGGGEER